jgi:hypothetical protein
VLESILASWLALAAPAQTPPSEQADLSEATRLFDEGMARYDAADFEGAIESFTRALQELRGQGVDDVRIRGLLMFNIGRTHMRAFEIDQKTEHLRQAKTIFTRFIEEAGQHPDEFEAGDIEEAQTQLVEIDRLLAPSDAAEPTEPTEDSPERPPPDSARLRSSGIGLTVAGAVVLGGGVGMLVWGAGYVPNAEREIAGLDAVGLPPESPAFPDSEAFLAAEKRKGAAWMASGGVAAAIGVVGVALGVRQLVRAKRGNEPGVTATASWSRQGAWIGVSGHF